MQAIFSYIRKTFQSSCIPETDEAPHKVHKLDSIEMSHLATATLSRIITKHTALKFNQIITCL